ncbi:MAG TPA: glycosyltransferase [Cyclobacteriaceae bacterium]|nr:glycosyltransferase [Cyclobacteriaceae bacterium]
MSANQKKKIVMLANAGHSPLDTRIFLKEAISLSNYGYEVSLIVPTQKDETVKGIAILSVPYYRGGWRKLVLCPWFVFRKALRQPKTAAFHLHDSELLVIGIWLKLLGRAVVYDAHEDTPLQISYQHWLPPFFRKPYAWLYWILEKIAGLLFDRIIVAEPVIAKYFPAGKTWLIRNFPIVADYDKGYIDYSQRPRRIVHIGSLTKVRGVEKMANAAALAKRKCEFEFYLGGQFSPPELQHQITKMPIVYLGPVPSGDVAKTTINARAGILVPQPIERYKTNYPVKLFEYMAAGVPIIATKYGEVASFVKECECGILVDPMNENEIADAIEYIFSNEQRAKEMGERGRVMVSEKYSWEKEAESLIKLYAQWQMS